MLGHAQAPPVARPDRSAPPPLGPAPALRLPPIQKYALSNGTPVWIVEQHEVPVVRLDLVIRAGAAADPPGQLDLASLTAMLEEGAGPRTSLQIADEIDYLGATLSTSSSYDASAVQLYVPVRHLTEALPIMADAARRPTFPPAELERLRQQRLTSLKQARADPQAIAATAFAGLVFGDAHRYGTPVVGTSKTIGDLSVEDLRRFHADHYRPANAAVVVVGDVTPARVLPVLESAFGDWKTEALGSPTLNAPREPKERRVFVIDRPDSAQSQIRIGGVGIRRDSPDYIAVEVLNTILGGAFTSRLNQNLREQHGYAYGAFSRFDSRRMPGPFFATAGVQTDKTSESLTEFFRELARIREPVPADELEKARNYLALRFPRSFETTGQIAERLAELIVYDLPDDEFDTYVTRVQAVTAGDVQRAAERYIHPGRFTVVVVGDRAAIETGIRQLNLGPVQVLGIEDVMP